MAYSSAFSVFCIGLWFPRRGTILSSSIEELQSAMTAQKHLRKKSLVIASRHLQPGSVPIMNNAGDNAYQTKDTYCNNAFQAGPEIFEVPLYGMTAL